MLQRDKTVDVEAPTQTDRDSSQPMKPAKEALVCSSPTAPSSPMSTVNAAREGRDVKSSASSKAIVSHPNTAYLSAGRSSAIRTSSVYETYWKFAVERQAIFFRRFRGQAEPWTEDPILQQHKFTNAYRASDRVSQYLIRHVIYAEGEGPWHDHQGLADPDDLFFRILLFKVFNRISTWQHLEAQLGRIRYEDYEFQSYATILTQLKARRLSIFSAAYIMPSGVGGFGYAEKHCNFLKLIETMIDDGVPWRLTELKTMREAFQLLRSYPMIGDFLAYQYVIDLNYSPLTNFSEMEFVMPGPGARDGIAKCFVDTGGLSEADIIRWVTERQQQEFDRMELKFQNLWGRPLQLIDCQNLFCEVDKYARVAHPEALGASGRTRIKQRFRPISEALIYWYPPKWGINQGIGAEEGGIGALPGPSSRHTQVCKTPQSSDSQSKADANQADG